MPSEQPARRVRDIFKAIGRIKAYVIDGGGVDALIRDDYLHRDAVERQLLVIAEAAAKLRGQVETLEPAIDWNAIRGMGNVIRHTYDGIDDEVISQVLTHELDGLMAACQRLMMRFGGAA